MKKPLIQRRRPCSGRERERGVTLALVAASIVAMLAMAALSVDVASLYNANCELQRAADAGALAGARSLALAGTTGDPTNSAAQWSAACLQAEAVARATAAQNMVGGTNVPLGLVTSAALDKNGNYCGSASGTVAFGVNPQVTVTISGINVPLFFAPVMRAFFSPGASRSLTVSAKATAEVYNPSAASGFAASGLQVPVAPRCVKPWLIPNVDPRTSAPFVQVTTGTINNQGIINTTSPGVIGEQISLRADCKNGFSNCQLTETPPKNFNATTLDYVPADISGPYVAVPSGATGSSYQEASGGCDVGTVYECGTANGASADMNINPRGNLGDTAVAVRALINQSGGYDLIDTTVYPFQITAGGGNPLVVSGAIGNGQIISSSNSIVTVPIYDNTNPWPGGATPTLTIVGYLQVFINDVAGTGHLDVTILNVSGCGTATASAVGGTSPVPVRLVQ